MFSAKILVIKKPCRAANPGRKEKNMNELKAIIKGETERGTKFEVKAKFNLLLPDEGEPHYGTGCYMAVDTGENHHLVDVRYEGTKDLKKLANRWIESYYGTNAREVTFVE